MSSAKQVIEEKVAEALFNHEKKAMGDAWYHQSETLWNIDDACRKPWIEAAKAAIEAIQPTPDVHELVELLGIMTHTAETYFSLLGGVKHPQQYEQLRQAKQALAKHKKLMGKYDKTD